MKELRKELVRLSPDEMLVALAEATKSLPLRSDYEGVVQTGKELREFPALHNFFEALVSARVEDSPYSQGEEQAFKVGVAITLYALKAAADRQAFEGLELPEDLR